jgi:hypothetical protein
MNAIQTVGLSLSLVAMIANFYEKVTLQCFSVYSLFLLMVFISYIHLHAIDPIVLFEIGRKIEENRHGQERSRGK